jgi:hypothetical protein
VLPILQQTGAAVVAEYVVARNATFVQKHLVENFPGLSDEEYQLIAVAWTGVGRGVLGSVVARAEMTDAEIQKAIEFVVRYNLRALRVPDADVESALANAREIVFPSPEE